jgi:hypothetical protein
MDSILTCKKCQQPLDKPELNESLPDSSNDSPLITTSAITTGAGRNHMIDWVIEVVKLCTWLGIIYFMIKTFK